MKRSRRNLITVIAVIAIGTGLVFGYSIYHPAQATGSSAFLRQPPADPVSALQMLFSPSVSAMEAGDPAEPPLPAGAAGSDRSASSEEPSRPLHSLLGASVVIHAPEVSAGEDLWATAEITNISDSLLCSVDWFYDGAAMEGNAGGYAVLHESSELSAGAAIEYSEDMPLEHTIGLMLSYTDPATGHTERLYNEANVTVHNYSRAYYIRKQNEEAIRNASSASEVSCVFKGSYSSSYDVDYSDAVKSAFINEGGYSSETGYLVWVNLATQKVNVFSGSRGSWELIHTWRCATGAPDTPTPTGVTYTTYKQTGWITDEYQVKYVTRFYPGSGYAFHSILYTPDGSSVLSGAVGYPKSHGCVRTEDAGVRWIYNNLPAHSTVVIY